MPIYDIHTHNQDAVDAIINIGIDSHLMQPGKYYSVGIHPWDAAGEVDFDRLETIATNPQVVAIGEVGLDALCGVDERRQREIFERQIEISERVGKPLIIHDVRRHPDMLRYRQSIRPTRPWILHGWRGNPQLTRSMLNAGFMFSLGEKANDDSISLIPPDHLFIETDESALAIGEIAALRGLYLRDFSPFFNIKS